MKATIAVDPVKTKDYDRIAGGRVPAAQLVKMSFEFLLEHEPKESILPRFDLLEIARYFPTFEPAIIGRLTKF